MNALKSLAYLGALVSFALVAIPRPASAIEITLVFDTPADQFPGYDPTGSKLEAIALAAADVWKDLLPYSNNSYGVTVHWGTFPANSTQLAVYNGFDHSINVRSNNAWFLDPTPDEHGEFLPFTQTLYRDLDFAQQNTFNGTPPDLLETGYTANAVPGGVADGVDDLLSVLLHEMGHFTEIGYNLLSPDVAIQSKFIGGIAGVSAKREDESHISPDNALLDPFLAQSQRVLPSALDVIVAANEQGHSDIRLRRVDWLGDATSPLTNFWFWDGAWEGNREPTTGTAVTIRDQALVTVASLPGSARSLLLAEESDLIVQDTLHVALDAEIRGSGGYDHPKITLSGASAAANIDRNLVVSLGSVELDGGELAVGNLLILDGEVSGNGFVNPSQITGHGTVHVGSQLRNRGRVVGDGGTLSVYADAGGDLDLDGNQENTERGSLRARTGNLAFYGPLNDLFDGLATIGGGHSIRFQHEWTFGGEGLLSFIDAGALSEFYTTEPAGHVTFDGSEISVDSGSLARIRAGVITLKNGAEVNVHSGAILGLNAGTEFYGGTYTGSGTIRQNGFAAVVTSTTINVAEYDWDGYNLPTPSDTLVEPNATFRLNVESLGGAYNGHVHLADKAVLDVNILAGFGVWQLGPESELIFLKNGRLQGSPVIVRGLIEAQAGSNHIEAPATLTGSSLVRIADKASLSMKAPFGLGGGVITTESGSPDDSTLHQYATSNVLEHHRITVGYFNWDASDDTNSYTKIQPGAFLDIQAKEIGNGVTDPFLFLFDRNGFGDVVDIDSGTLGVQVGYEGRDGTFPDRWTLNKTGVMNLNWVEHGLPTVRGSKLVNRGLVSGTGEFLNPLDNLAAMEVGHAGDIGFIRLSNVFTQTDEGLMAFELAGLAPTTQHDQIDHAQSMALDGTLRVSLIGGFQPTPGDVFRIITGDIDAPIAGTFAAKELPPGQWDVIYGPYFVDLRYVAVPEPGTVALVVAALPAIFARAIKRRRPVGHALRA